MKRVGITTTIPVEVVYAAGCVPVDLNNVFINSPDAAALVAEAEHAGYPRNACGWIKGIYSTVSKGCVDAVIAVVEGDCSQTQAMVETLEMSGIEIIPFAYPYSRDRDMLRLQIDKLIQKLGTTWEEAEKWKKRLDAIRKRVWMLDELTWQNGSLNSFDNHYFQICCSDFNGNPDAFEAEVDEILRQAQNDRVSAQGNGVSAQNDGGVAPNKLPPFREQVPETPTLHSPLSTPHSSPLCLGYIGVPPIFTDFYEFIESLGVRIVFNEVQRQFSMPHKTSDIVEQYALYTYPYDIFARIEDIKREVEKRSIAGLLHYTQSFCFRQIQDLIIRKRIDIPILTIEGESPGKLDARTRVRIESFIEMLS
jgi:benzoyl-CoA reductase/2-hydroxyglutaryl-CoA dehydratase subunit BcrC/BadD/HgdB